MEKRKSEPAGLTAGGRSSSDAAASFNEELARLQRAVEALERGDLDLEESVRLFEAGQNSQKRCQEILAGAQARIEVLTGTDPVSFAPFSVPSSAPSSDEAGSTS